MIHPYEGTESYLFVSYSRKDWNRIAPILEGMVSAGYRLWYDGGIPWGAEWADVIESRLENCAACLAFLSEHPLKSKYFRQEIHYAVENDKPILPVYLEDKSPSWRWYGLKLQLSLYQSVKFDGLDSFLSQLDNEPLFTPCKAAPEFI